MGAGAEGLGADVAGVEASATEGPGATLS